MAETLFNSWKNISALLALPRVLPKNANRKNQLQDTKIQLIVKIYLKNPWYSIEFVPITPIVSNKACGFNRETDAANMICFLKEYFFDSPSFFPEGLLQVV